jgi:hypothetical protein
MSDKPDSDLVPEASGVAEVAIPPLDGAWFRRERERVAIGRRTVAARVGSSESKLCTLELRRQVIPESWLSVLQELGFRIPAGRLPAMAVAPNVAAEVESTAPAAVSPAPVSSQVDAQIEVPIEVQSVTAVAAPAVAAQSESVPVVIAEFVTPAPAVAVEAPVVESVPEVVSAPVPEVTPAVTAEAAHESNATVAAEPESAPTVESDGLGPEGALFHGHWLRVRRHRRGVDIKSLSKQLGASVIDLYALERHNIRLPLRWIPVLLKRKLLSVGEAKTLARLPTDSQLNGTWLLKQRALHRLSPYELGHHVRATGADIRLIERRAWPLPLEWFPSLKALFESRKKAAKKAAESAAKQAVESAVPPAPAAPQSEPAVETPIIKRGPGRPPKVRVIEPDIAEAIVAYRLKLGQHARLPAIEVLAQIAKDLLLAKGRDAISYGELTAALQALLKT